MFVSSSYSNIRASCLFGLVRSSVSQNLLTPLPLISFIILSTPTTLLELSSDRSVAAAPKLDTTATSIDVNASTRIEIATSQRIESATPEVTATSFDICGYCFVVIRDDRRSF